MPWWLGPRAAVGGGLLSAFALTAATGVLRPSLADHPDPHRTEHTPPSMTLGDRPFAGAASAAPPVSPGAEKTSIDDTLTLDAAGCAGVRSTSWHPLSGLEYTGRVHITVPPLLGGAIALYVGSDVPLDVEAETDGGELVSMTRERFRFGPGVRLPPDFWIEYATPLDAPREITSVVIDARGDRALGLRLLLGRRAPRVIARLIGYGDDVVAPVCAAPLTGDDRYFATGWYGEEPASRGVVRWMREHGAVLVPSAQERAARVRLRAAPSSAARSTTVSLRLRVNETLEFDPVVMRAGFAEYQWLVPDAAWVAGTNELFFTVSHVERQGSRTLGLALASLDVH